MLLYTSLRMIHWLSLGHWPKGVLRILSYIFNLFQLAAITSCQLGFQFFFFQLVATTCKLQRWLILWSFVVIPSDFYESASCGSAAISRVPSSSTAIQEKLPLVTPLKVDRKTTRQLPNELTEKTKDLSNAFVRERSLRKEEESCFSLLRHCYSGIIATSPPRSIE